MDRVVVEAVERIVQESEQHALLSHLNRHVEWCPLCQHLFWCEEYAGLAQEWEVQQQEKGE